jgi:hypothetical protein
MKTFKDLVFKTHPVFNNGTAAKLDFPNGYSVSVVTGDGAYQNEGEYEVAVLKDNKLSYDTHITDDVLGWQSEDEVTEIMKQIQELPK